MHRPEYDKMNITNISIEHKKYTPSTTHSNVFHQSQLDTSTMRMPVTASKLLFRLLLVVQYHNTIVLVTAERSSFYGDLEPDPSIVNYAFGQLEAPGSVDLSSLLFSTADPNDNDSVPNPHPAHGSVVDVVVFYDPQDSDEVFPSEEGGGETFGRISMYDWEALGIGKVWNGEYQWCCTEKIFATGSCDGPVGQLILDRGKFKGQRRSFDIPPPPNVIQNQVITDPIIKIPSGAESGAYVVLMTNCNINGRLVEVRGTYAFQSKSGFLPANLIGTKRFYFLMLAAYSLFLVAAFWWLGYSCWHQSVVLSAASRMSSVIAPSSRGQSRRQLMVQRGIVATIGLGLLEAMMRSLDYIIWNSSGFRSNALVYMTIVPDVSKHVLSRTLLVMLGLGWGVVPAPASVSTVSMRQHYIRLVILGTIFFILTASGKILDLQLIARLQNFNQIGGNIVRVEVEYLGVLSVLSLCILGIDALYAVYIAATLSATMKYLELNHGSSRSLVRYRQLRTLVLVVIAVAVLYMMVVRFEILDNKQDNTVLSWIVFNLMEFDYFILIACVTYLWRPTDSEVLLLLEGEEDDEGDDDVHNGLELRGEEMQARRSLAAYSAVEQHDLELTADDPVTAGVAT